MLAEFYSNQDSYKSFKLIGAKVQYVMTINLQQTCAIFNRIAFFIELTGHLNKKSTVLKIDKTIKL